MCMVGRVSNSSVNNFVVIVSYFSILDRRLCGEKKCTFIK